MSPALVLLAAGVGSRYGSPKQIDPVGPGGATLIDYAAFDARRVGFDRVVLVVRAENESEVRAAAGDRVARRLPVDYAVQDAALPAGFEAPPGRTKPWGTGHAVLAAAPHLHGPFAVLNADDFYGARSYRILAEWFRRARPEREHALVSFDLRSTLSPAGPVNRGLCRVDERGALREIREVLRIEGDGENARHTENGGVSRVSGDTPVSLNFWGFAPDVVPAFESSFEQFLGEHGTSTSAELFIPDVVQPLIDSGAARVRVLPGGGPWAGLTHPEDRDHLVALLADLTTRGEYPRDLWT
ncbi:MAG: NTP transferase domain-containing protein [Acidobacteriota bacterium]|jgi:NDP-sugar pyrophosphorylase family protein